MLVDLLTLSGQKVPLEILPERVLARTADTVVWWMPAGLRVLFFSDRGQDPVLERLNGQRYPQPPLVFKAAGSKLWVRALTTNTRPRADSAMYMAPYWNCYDHGVVCTGSMRIPQEKSVAAIDAWEHSFFHSEFTHAAGVKKHTRYPGGFLALWDSLRGKKRFPVRYLVTMNQTLADFVANNDADYRNHD